MTEEERRDIFESFLQHGMDISPFMFTGEVDKLHFFGMYEEYLIAMSDKKTEVIFDAYKDITVLNEDKVVCNFYITEDYRTLKVQTEYSIEDKELVVCLTMMFLTIKELKTMIDTLSDAFKKSSLGKEYSTTADKREFVSTSKLPKDIKNTIAKISELQKSILKENKKYIIRTTKKDDE
tara:strand:- start:1698 stop:2234 length:537 start_codon:yes stop_codon:yes gene_type:complete